MNSPLLWAAIFLILAGSCLTAAHHFLMLLARFLRGQQGSQLNLVIWEFAKLGGTKYGLKIMGTIIQRPQHGTTNFGRIPFGYMAMDLATCQHVKTRAPASHNQGADCSCQHAISSSQKLQAVLHGHSGVRMIQRNQPLLLGSCVSSLTQVAD